MIDPASDIAAAAGGYSRVPLISSEAAVFAPVSTTATYRKGLSSHRKLFSQTNQRLNLGTLCQALVWDGIAVQFDVYL